MAIPSLSDRRVQLRQDSDDEYDSEEYDSDETGEEREQEHGSETSSQTDASSEDANDQASEPAESSSEEEDQDLKDISFGALVKAQATFAPASKSRKRKLSDIHQEDQPQNGQRPQDTEQERYAKPPKTSKLFNPTRSSKHAPTIQSSRHPVSRKRDIFASEAPNPALQFRDPRFDATVTQATLNRTAAEKADRNYSFLTTYQATELLDLKSQIKKAQSKDPELAATLKQQVMSLEARLRNAETKTKEREILRKHKQKEKEAIREGKKSQPYFLKKSDVKREIEREKMAGMGKKAKDKLEKNRRKREKTKEARDMPRFRRG